MKSENEINFNIKFHCHSCINSVSRGGINAVRTAQIYTDTTIKFLEFCKPNVKNFKDIFPVNTIPAGLRFHLLFSSAGVHRMALQKTGHAILFLPDMPGLYPEMPSWQ